MIKVPGGVGIIEKYPFRFENLVIDVLAKSTDWKKVLQNLQVKEEFEKLAKRAYRLGNKGSKTIVCPSPVHGNTLTSSKELRVLSVAKNQVAIYRGTEADGAEINQGEVYALASGDCLTVSLYDSIEKTAVGFHFSRETGVNGKILEGALNAFPRVIRPRMFATITLGIHPDHFLHNWDDPKYGEKNRGMTERVLNEFGRDALGSDIHCGGLNLHFIAATKLIRAGFQSKSIYVDHLDTYSDKRFWSNRASIDESSPKYGEIGRNLVLVANLKD